MPARRTLSAIQSGAPRTAKDRQPQARHAAGAYIHARRCPYCQASLRHVKPVARRVLDAATIVAQRATQGLDTTSHQVAEALSTTRKRITVSQAGQLLAQGVEDGLLARYQRNQRRGGLHYRYESQPLLVAFVEQDRLATDLAQALGRVQERQETLQAAVQPRSPLR